MLIINKELSYKGDINKHNMLQDRVPCNYADFQEYIESRLTREEIEAIEKQAEEELKEENELSAHNTPSN